MSEINNETRFPTLDLTKFPTPDFPNSFRANMFSAREYGLYQVTEVNEWIKRCIEDFPEDVGYHPDDTRVQIWFSKWFNQFIEEEVC